MTIAFLFTTYNRKEKTYLCIQSIKAALRYAANKGIVIEDEWYVTDARSMDGTVAMLLQEIEESKLHLCVENNDTYYSQGMRKSMEKLSLTSGKTVSGVNYVMIMNDDVLFYEDFLYRMLTVAADRPAGRVLVGATDSDGTQTYGGIRYSVPVGVKNHMAVRSIHYSMVKISDINHGDEKSGMCDTFNANCVLIPIEVFNKVGLMDERYVHGLGDFDYGMCIRKCGYEIESADFYVGCCEQNSKKGTWMDTSLSRYNRIKKLTSVKGAPTGPWFYYLNKHFGLMTAIAHSVSPYIRIIAGK